MLTWTLLEVAFDGAPGTYFTGFPTAVGSATGCVVGLVGITPSAGLVSPMWALFIGFFTTIGVFFAPRLLKKYLKVNDTLDCFAVHGIGGMIGSALTGLFSNPSYSNLSAATAGGFYSNAVQLGIQCAGITVTIVFSAIVTAIIYGILYAIAKLLKTTLTIPSNMAPDVSQHGEKAYSSATTRADLAVRAADAPSAAVAGVTASV
jgi:Amt family ammonium transporter